MAQKPEIVLIQKVLPTIEAELDRDYAVHRISGRNDIGAISPAVLGLIRAVVTGGGTGISPELVEALPALEMIAINGVGLDAVDLEHAGREHGRRVRAHPGGGPGPWN